MKSVTHFKKDQLYKVMCSFTFKVPVSNKKKFVVVFWLGFGLTSKSPHSKSKLHLKHR